MVQTICFSLKYLNDYVTTTFSSSTNTDEWTAMTRNCMNLSFTCAMLKSSWYDIYMLTNSPHQTHMKKQMFWAKC